MDKLFDHEAYKTSYSHRMAYIEGKLDICDEIIQIAHFILANNRVNLFKPNSDFEEGQVTALTAILDSIAVIQKSAEMHGLSDKTLVFDT